MKTGIILLSHGSRSPEAQVTVKELLEMVKENSSYYFVTGAALQFNQPDLPTAVAETVAAGVDRIVVAPVFLYMGLHMKEDIPEILAEERKKYPGVEIVMTRNIGADKKLSEIVLERIGEVL